MLLMLLIRLLRLVPLLLILLILLRRLIYIDLFGMCVCLFVCSVCMLCVCLFVCLRVCSCLRACVCVRASVRACLRACYGRSGCPNCRCRSSGRANSLFWMHKLTFFARTVVYSNDRPQAQPNDRPAHPHDRNNSTV